MLEVHRPLHGYLNTGNAVVTHDAQDRLGEIRCPTLILIGEQDIITTVDQSRDMQRRIAGSELLVFPNTLHGFMSERPDAFQSIIDFFARN